MPRNRKTKGRGTSGVHAKATVPDGDEGHQLESELKAEKIQTMISDFDMEGIRFNVAYFTNASVIVPE